MTGKQQSFVTTRIRKPLFIIRDKSAYTKIEPAGDRSLPMSRLRSCPSCQHGNSVYLTRCQQCGAPLKTPEVETTVSMFPIPVAEDLRQSYLLRRTNLTDGHIALYIAGERLPLTLEYQERVVLGRSPDTPSKTHIDLTRYRAHELGVSRQHAAISIPSEGDMTLEDLGSSNGTWLNGIRLSPRAPQHLRNGDLVQLGQLVLYVYLQEKAAEQGS